MLFTPAGPGGRLLLQTRRGSLVQDRFPDLVAAAEQLPEGLVLDGQLVVWDAAAGRLSFEALQRRAAARGRTATALAAKTPEFFIAFDALQIDGIELLALPYAECRRSLEVLFAARALTAPWTLCPMTTDPDKAREWLEDWTDVSGVEGILVKNMNQRYWPGVRSAGRGTLGRISDGRYRYRSRSRSRSRGRRVGRGRGGGSFHASPCCLPRLAWCGAGRESRYAAPGQPGR
ncbi:hypothetical protein ACFCYH_12090 [Streptomyces sp. NPDC056400]|uniref:ATP-dependent DNA ligase n=1 Tax=Streptomyces sp. NPDC056400 TaxID=3345808 RepID=UPI0035E270B9